MDKYITLQQTGHNGMSCKGLCTIHQAHLTNVNFKIAIMLCRLICFPFSNLVQCLLSSSFPQLWFLAYFHFCENLYQVLKNGVEVKLQRNALSVLEPPTGNEEDDEYDFDDSSSGSEIAEKDHHRFCK